MGTHRFDFDLAVIGGGAAGLTVAAGAAQLGAKVLLAEREPALGGDCLHYGCVPSKALIHCAAVRRQMTRAGEWGLPQPELPPVDFARVAARIRSVIAAIQPHDSEERFCGLGVRVAFGPASFVDDHTIDVDGARHTARHLVIATGSSPAPAPVAGIDGLPPGVARTNRDIFSLDTLPASLVVLGAGPIACEMAQAFARLGSHVTMVQRGGQILSREDKDMADIVLHRLRAEGVAVLLDTRAVAVRPQGAGAAIAVAGPDGARRELVADTLLVALGRVPNMDGLGLDNAGVAFSGRGVAVDARLRTSRPHIFAAGDVTGAYQFTHAAGYEGGIVLANTVFRLPRKADYTWLPWATYTDPELASVGLNEKRATAAGVAYTAWTEPFSRNDRALATGQAEGRIKLLLGPKGKPLGVQIAGPHAGELINEWIAVAGGGVKLATLAGLAHPYPTLGEINKRVAGNVLADTLFSGKVKKALTFLFRLKGRACGDG
ncbi:MAG: NAD(P)/FAD-dependent oxidoreductase [Desulfovibrionaceae bacterium]